MHLTNKDMTEKIIGCINPTNSLEDAKIVEEDRSTDVKNAKCLFIPSATKRAILYHRWLEAFPMVTQTAETVAATFFAGCVEIFGVPGIITTDQGRQFESELFRSLSRFLGAQKTQNVTYNPNCNVANERFHRSLKNAIKYHAKERWLDVLPLILLAICASLLQRDSSGDDIWMYTSSSW
ncbi:hypothetical protein AVEN_27616-1 [Araneus ventricosus]|uniref:Integrase catalytic domain-containing protein n=1 Tax=Araneus ventricosus TaxID=182803 RepID=A0A4Y2EMU1_ARAVE|nr:hypothetical protein AVEN_27616-1 [Araneus ventricosus]